MKTLNYKEIYYTSSECSIITQSAGIGIRTYTTGMDSHEASTIAEKCVFGYSVDDSRMLRFKQLQQNPKIVYDYSPAYIFNKVTLDNGSTKYVLGRTVYIGIDYGYFCNRDDAMRAGTNYFTHLLVFDEMPPVSIFAEIENKNIFSPVDYTCSPDNAELQYLLTGKPTLLAPKSLQCGTGCDCRINIDFAYCIVAFLQSYYNTINNKENDLRKIIIKAPTSQTPELIRKMALLPQILFGEKSFMSNYMQGYGVPGDFNMIFVNEFNKNELYENNHICIDLFNKSTTNVDDNYIYKKILKLSEEGDNITIQKLIKYYIGLDLAKELNYQFLYNLFIAIESDKDLLLQDISKDFIAQLNNVRLSSIQETALWNKINNAINRGLMSKQGAEVNNAITVVGYILPANNRNLKITAESSTWITTVCFGKTSYFGRIVNTANVDTIITLIDREQIRRSQSDFYNALKQTTDITLWAKFIQFYYQNTNAIVSNMDYVIDNILSSNIAKKEREVFIQRLYPVDKLHNELLSYISSHTHHIPELIETVKTICLNSREECFSSILRQCYNDPAIIKTLAPIVSSYYDKQIDDDPKYGMNNLLSFIDRISVDVFNMMGITKPFDKYINMSMENPSKEIKPILNHLLNSKIKIDRTTLEQIEILNDLFDNKIPRQIDINILITAHKITQRADDIGKLYNAWLKTQPTSKELTEYIKKSVEYLSSKVIEELILRTWESKTRMIHENRKDYVLIISDNSNWKSRDKKSFIKSDYIYKDLAHHLTDSDKFTKKITRKIFNLFKS